MNLLKNSSICVLYIYILFFRISIALLWIDFSVCFSGCWFASLYLCSSHTSPSSLLRSFKFLCPLEKIKRLIFKVFLGCQKYLSKKNCASRTLQHYSYIMVLYFSHRSFVFIYLFSPELFFHRGGTKEILGHVHLHLSSWRFLHDRQW